MKSTSSGIPRNPLSGRVTLGFMVGLLVHVCLAGAWAIDLETVAAMREAQDALLVSASAIYEATITSGDAATAYGRYPRVQWTRSGQRERILEDVVTPEGTAYTKLVAFDGEMTIFRGIYPEGRSLVTINSGPRENLRALIRPSWFYSDLQDVISLTAFLKAKETAIEGIVEEDGKPYLKIRGPVFSGKRIVNLYLDPETEYSISKYSYEREGVEDTIFKVIEKTSTQMGEHTIWFPTRAERRGYTKEGGTTFVEEYAVSSYELNPEISDDLFHPVPELGDKVTDWILGVSYVVGEEAQQ